MVDNKNLYDPAHPGATTTIQIDISNFSAAGKAQVWQLAATNPSDQTKANITQLGDVTINGNILTITVPQESVTLLVDQARVPIVATSDCHDFAGLGGFGQHDHSHGHAFHRSDGCDLRVRDNRDAGRRFRGQLGYADHGDGARPGNAPQSGGYVRDDRRRQIGPVGDRSVHLHARPGQPGAIEFAAATQSVNEDAGTIQITLTRTGGSDGAVSVHYATTDGTAQDGTDYSQTSGTVSFAAGQTSKSFNVDHSEPGQVRRLDQLPDYAERPDRRRDPGSDQSADSHDCGHAAFGAHPVQRWEWRPCCSRTVRKRSATS